MLKRILSILLCAVLLCMLCPGCAREQKKLRICFDVGSTTDASFLGEGGSKQKHIAESFLRYLDDCAATTGGVTSKDVELELIPSDSSQSTERQAALQRIRTEIMSGEGPDVFICFAGEMKDAFGPPEEGRLFPYVDKAIDEGFFLPLDEYIGRAVLMQWDDFFPGVMEGGKNREGKQVVLPMAFTVAALLYDREDLPAYDSAGKTWEDVLSGSDPILAEQVRAPWEAYTSPSYDSDRRDLHSSLLSSVFSQLADFQKGELCFTEEELFRQVKTIMERGQALMRTDPLYPNEVIFLDDNNLVGGHGAADNRDFTLIPLRNTAGGTTAQVRLWCAVNKNTKLDREAFSVVDALMSEPFQKAGELYKAVHCRSVNKKLESSEIYDMLMRRPATKESWMAAAEQIDAVNYPSPLNDKLAELMKAVQTALLESTGSQVKFYQIYSESMKGAVSDEELRSFVHDFYQQLQRLVDEA